MPTAITPDRIAATEALIRPHIRRTPVIALDAAEFGLAPAALTFKLELMQHAGSFKTRGAFAKPAGARGARGRRRGRHRAATMAPRSPTRR
jgi:threonine dehydratase